MGYVRDVIKTFGEENVLIDAVKVITRAAEGYSTYEGRNVKTFL